MRRIAAACGSARIPTGVLATFTVVVSLMLVPVAGQAQPATADTWTPPRTAWGEPDLQGIWDFRTLTPLERPSELAEQEVWTDEEAAVLEQSAEEFHGISARKAQEHQGQCRILRIHEYLMTAA